jgi:Glyoxalase/Bleomycin resistance protein/Dioxygenase superfamily
MRKATPILTVEAIEPCLPFWTGLGFEITASVPQGEALAFAMLQMGPVELMYQSRASIDADLGASGAPAELGADLAGSTAALFVEVEDLDAVISSIGDAEVIVPRRTTFYGMDEIFVRAPCGTLVGFAAKSEG